MRQPQAETNLTHRHVLLASGVSALLTIALLVLPSASQAQEIPDPLWSEQRPTADRSSAPLRFDTFANLAERLSPAVVNIDVTVTRATGWTSGESEGQGTGFFIHRDGYLITNAHVIDDASSIVVTTDNGLAYSAEVIGVDVATDLALLRVEADREFPVAPLGRSSELRPGDWVIAIGNPYGLTQTVTAGIISALGRRELARGGGYANFIQTDAPINFGNSGGPLINVNGEVVGVNTAIRTGNDIGFAIPADMVKALLPQLARGEVERAWLGVQLEAVDSSSIQRYGLERPRGALVSGVIPGSPAAEGGIQSGDLITDFNGETVEDVQHLRWLAASSPVGSEVNVELVRNQQREATTVTMGSRDDMATRTPASTPGGSSPSPPQSRQPGGLNGQVQPEGQQNIPSSIGIGVRDGSGGVVVQEVHPSSIPFRMGVRIGDVVVTLNGTQVDNVDTFRRLVAGLSGGDTVQLTLRRGTSLVQVAYRVQ